MTHELKPEGFLHLADDVHPILQAVFASTNNAVVFVAPSVEESLEPNAQYGQFAANWSAEVGAVAMTLESVQQAAKALGNQMMCVDFTAADHL
jgi:hypothetical protein